MEHSISKQVSGQCLLCQDSRVITAKLVTGNGDAKVECPVCAGDSADLFSAIKTWRKHGAASFRFEMHNQVDASLRPAIQRIFEKWLTKEESGLN